MPRGSRPPPPSVRFAWANVLPGEDTTLADGQLTAVLTNETEAEVVVAAEWLGDLGTTHTYRGTLEEITLPPGEDAEIKVDLASLFPTLTSKYSGHLHLFGRLTGTEDEVDLGSAISPDLYFHVDSAGVVAYDESRLLAAHRAGDFNGLESETEQLVDEEGDSALVRIVQYEADAQAPAPSEIELGSAGSVVSSTGGQAVPVAPAIGDLMDEPSSPAAIYPHTLCVSYQVQTVDSGSTNSQGLTEDYWTNADSGINVFAHGVRVVVGAATYDTNALGCVTFTSPYPAFGANVKVWAFATDIDGNYVRMHNGPSNSTSSYPGSTYSWTVSNVPFVSGAITAVAAGSYTPRATAMASLAFSHFRYHDGISDRALHVSDQAGSNPFDEDDCDANVNYLNDVNDEISYIKFVSAGAPCDFHNLYNKFVVSHEYGHAYSHQFANEALTLPASTTHSATPAGTCSFGAGAIGYDNNTKEWSSIGIREGFAHFVSARIWNDAAADGQFRWGTSFDLERWNASNTVGGYLVNQCCPGTSSSCETSLDGAGVLTDWMRAFWDIHTDSICDLSAIEMAALYGWTIGQPNLTNDGFFPTTQITMSIWGATCESRWDWIACYNGIDRQGQAWTGC